MGVVDERVAVDCAVIGDWLRDCRVQPPASVGAGLEKSALDAAAIAVLAPGDVDAPQVNTRIRFVLRFRVEEPLATLEGPYRVIQPIHGPPSGE